MAYEPSQLSEQSPDGSVDPNAMSGVVRGGYASNGINIPGVIPALAGAVDSVAGLFGQTPDLYGKAAAATQGMPIIGGDSTGTAISIAPQNILGGGPSQLSGQQDQGFDWERFWAGVSDAGRHLGGHEAHAAHDLMQRRQQQQEMEAKQQEAKKQKLFKDFEQFASFDKQYATDPKGWEQGVVALAKSGNSYAQTYQTLGSPSVRNVRGQFRDTITTIEKMFPDLAQQVITQGIQSVPVMQLQAAIEAAQEYQKAESKHLVMDALVRQIKAKENPSPADLKVLGEYEKEQLSLDELRLKHRIGTASEQSSIQAAQQAGPQAAANLQKTQGEVIAQGATSPLFHSLSQPVRDVLAAKGKTAPNFDDISQAVAQATAVNAGLDGTNDQLMAMGIDPRTASAEQRQAAKEAIFERARELKRIESGEVLTQKINIERKAALQPARAFLDELKPTVDKIFTASGPLERLLKTPGANIKIWLQTDPDAIAYQTLTNGFLAKLSRAAGEVGVLTEQDVQRAKALLPVFTPIPDTKEVAHRKLTDLNKLLEEIGNRNVTPPGKANVVNKLTPEAQGVLERLNKKATGQ